jgi:hypothetical protein
VFDTNIPIDELSGLSIVSEPVSPDASPEMLSAGETTFEGPAVVGRSIITATLTTGQGDASSHAWLVDVPDREGDLETLFEMVPPGVELRATDAVVTGTAGNGCYAYLCSDSGAAPVPSDLTPLRAAVGETLQVRTADGSGLIGWSGRLLPEAETAGLPLEVAHRQADPIGVMALGGLEPTAPGAWVLLLRVDLDRERGWLWHAYRLTAE